MARTKPLVVERKFFVGNEYLKLLSGKEELMFDAQDGSKLISEQKDRFEVYELIQDSKFTTFFNSVGIALDKLCLTQVQIINFICKHENWLRTEGYETFFLVKRGGKFFVVDVYFDDDGGLGTSVYELESGIIWRAEYGHRVVLPQLEL